MRKQLGVAANNDSDAATKGYVDDVIDETIGFLFDGDPTGVADSTTAMQSAIDNYSVISIPAGTYKIGQINHTGASRTIRALGPVAIIQTTASGVFAFKGGWDLLGTVNSFTISAIALEEFGESSSGGTSVSVLTLASAATVTKGDVLKVISDDINPYGRPALIPKMGEYSLAGLSSTGTTVTLTNVLVEPYATNIRLVRLQRSTFIVEGDITFDTDPAIRDTNFFGAVLSIRSAIWSYVGRGVKFFNSLGRAIDNTGYRSTFENIHFRNLANRPSLNQYGYGIQDSGWQTVMSGCHGENLRHLYSEGSGTLNFVSSDYDKYGGGWYAQISDCTGVNCQSQVFDTHGTAYSVTFSDCHAIGTFKGAASGGPGFSARGRYTTFRNCIADSGWVGFNVTGTGTRVENCIARRIYFQALQIVGDTSDATGITTIKGIIVEGGVFETLANNEAVSIGADGFNITARLKGIRARKLGTTSSARGISLVGTGVLRVDMKDVVVDLEEYTGTGATSSILIGKDAITLRCDGLNIRGGSAPYTSHTVIASNGASNGNGSDVEILDAQYEHASVNPTMIASGIAKQRVSYLGSTRFSARAFGINPSNADNTSAFTLAMTTIAALGGGTLFLENGIYLTGMFELWDTVSIEGESRKGARIKLKDGAGTDLIRSREFSLNTDGVGFTAWGTVNAPKNFRIANLTLDGNAINQPVPGARSDWRDNSYLLKLWAWHFELDSIDLVDGREGALYTEHTASWEATFNQYAGGESKFSNLNAKNYWVIGWVNRGPHDSTIEDVILSSYRASSADAQYGYIQQNSANYGAQGCIANNLHIWGEHDFNAVYLDGSNIISGWVYAEGCDASAIKLVNSASNNFDAFVGYCTHGIELFSGNNNHVRAFVESNVSGSLFKLRATSGDVLEQLPGGNPTGAIFDCTTGGGNYTGGNNVLISARPFAPSALVTGTPHASDRLELLADASTDANDSTHFTWPMGATKVELKKLAGSANGYLDLGLTELISAGQRVAITAKTGAYTLTDADYAVTASASGGAFSLTLPTAVGRTGKLFAIKKTDSSGNAVTIATTSSQTIDGSTTYVLSVQYAYALVQSDGANWQVLASNGGLDSDLATIAGLSATTDNFIQAKSSAWASRTIAQVKTDLGLTGTNSGDQTSIVGITGTKAQFDTAVTDGNFLFSGDVSQYTDELAQDAIGTIVVDTDTIDIIYTDATPELKADVRTQLSITSDSSGVRLSGDSGSPGNSKLYGTNGSGVKGWYDQPAGGGGVSDGDKGDITVSASGVTWTIDSDVVTYAKIQDISATSRILGRITAGAGDAEELTGANVRTIAGLATTDSPELTAINIGHATDTTLTRSAAGLLAVEGVVIPTISSTSTLTNKTLTSPRINEFLDTNGVKVMTMNPVTNAVNYLRVDNNAAGSSPAIIAIGTDTNVSINLIPKNSGTLQQNGVPVATISGTQTLTNKTLTSPVISTIVNTGTITLPTSTDTLVGRATTDTLTNKTLTSPVIATIVNTGTLTLPTSTDTLVGRATTDTLTNKTLTSPVIATIVNTGTLTLPTSTDTLVGRATTDTLTSKRVTPRVGTTASSATPTINTDTVDFYSITAQTEAITSFTTNLSGTPTDGQKLWIAITGTAARAITWGASFEASTVALPTTTVTTARLDVGFVWNAVTSKWRCVATC